MNPRYQNRTYRSAAQAAHSKVMAARQALAAELEAAEEEPMRRYPHPIAQSTSDTCAVPSCAGSSAAMTQVLEQLSCQSQLLVDLLAAVNALTAAVLAQNNK